MCVCCTSDNAYYNHNIICGRSIETIIIKKRKKFEILCIKNKIKRASCLNTYRIGSLRLLSYTSPPIIVAGSCRRHTALVCPWQWRHLLLPSHTRAHPLAHILYRYDNEGHCTVYVFFLFPLLVYVMCVCFSKNAFKYDALTIRFFLNFYFKVFSFFLFFFSHTRTSFKLSPQTQSKDYYKRTQITGPADNKLLTNLGISAARAVQVHFVYRLYSTKLYE